MSSKTPRTDAVALVPDDGLREHRLWLLAQKLEEELGMETERVSRLGTDLAAAIGRENRLVEAGDRMAAARDREWLSEADYEAIIDDWHKAKETKQSAASKFADDLDEVAKTIGELEAKINLLKAAMTTIANADHRGNRSPESSIAAQALKEDKAT